MRIQLETEYATPTLVAHVGDVVDLPDVEAKALIAGRYAVAVDKNAVAPRRRDDVPGLIVGEVGPRDDRWTDPELLGVLVERDEQLRRRQERERK